MRGLVPVAAVTGVVLILGSALWLTRGPVEDGGRPAVATVSAPTVRESSRPPPSVPQDARPEPRAPDAPARPEPLVRASPAIAGLAASDAAVGLLLYGAVRDESGEILDVGDAWVSLSGPDGRERAAPLVDSTYSVAGLIPGAWKLSLGIDGFRSFESVVELAAEQPVTRFDVVLLPSVVLCVRLTTPGGAPLAGEAGWSDLAGALAVVVTRERPLPRLPSAGNTSLRAVGLGGVSTGLDLDADGDGSGCAARLVVDVDLPVFVSLALHHVVLATQRAGPSATEVVFVLRPESIRRALGGLRVTVLDAASRLPVPGATVRLSDGEAWNWAAAVDAEGVASIAELAPGSYYLDVAAPDHEGLSRQVTLAVGEQTETLMELDPATHIRGAVVDESGAPVSTSITVVPLEHAGDDWWTFRRQEWQSDGDGSFDIGPVGRERFVLLVVDSEHASRPLIVDTRSGDVDGVRLLAGTPVLVDLEAAWPDDHTHRVRITDADGSPVRAYDWRGGRHGPMPVAPGRYQAQVDDLAPLVFEAAGSTMLVTLRP